MSGTISGPCVRYDLHESEYHADPVHGGSLSQTWAKNLLAQGGPARFQWALHHPKPLTPAFSLGRAVHHDLLGGGDGYVVSPHAEFRSKEARAWRDDVEASGRTWVKPEVAEQVAEVVAAVRSQPLAMELLTGDAEVSMFTRDPAWGVMLRGRADVVGPRGLVDLKTTSKLATPDEFLRSVLRFGYHQQAAWYLDQASELGLCEPRFTFVVVETEAPYCVGYYELDSALIEMGRELNAQAIGIYARCREVGEWPGIPAEVQVLCPPEWAIDDEIEIED